MKTASKRESELLQENAELRVRLQEAEEALRAISAGEVDAVVMKQRVYTLQSAETPYRHLIEAMNEGAATMLEDATLLYANRRLCELIHAPFQELIASSFRALVAPADLPGFDALLASTKHRPGKGEFCLNGRDGMLIPVQLSINALDLPGGARALCVVATDLTERRLAEQALRQTHDALEQRVIDRTKELLQANEAVRESEQRFRLMANAMPQLAWIARPDGHIIWYNQRWYDYTGTAPEQMEGWGWQSVHDPAELPKVLDRWKASIATGEVFDMIFPLRGADGIFRPFLTRVTPMKDASGRVVQWFGTNTNVDELKRTEEALRASEAQFEALFENMQAGFAHCQMVFDDDGRPVDFIYLKVNSAFGRLTGLENAVGKRVTDLLPGFREAHPEMLETYARVARTGEPERMEINFKPLGMWLVIASYSPQPGQFAAVFDNITERKRIEQALRESEARLAAFADATFEGIVLSHQGRILDCNERFEQMLGYPPGELTDRAIADLVAPEDHERVIEDLRLDQESLIECRMLRRDGSRILVETRGKPNELDGHRHAAVRDITEQRRREDELRHLNRTLRALSNSNQALMRARDEAEFMHEVCQIIVRDCGHSMTWIGLAQADAAKTVRSVAHAGLDEGYLRNLNVTWADTERGRGPTGTAIRTGKPDRCLNMLTDPRFAPWRGQALKRGYASSIAIPLLAEEKAFGALTIYSPEPDPFSEQEVGLLTELAGDLALGIQTLRLRAAQARAEHQLREMNQQLEGHLAERTALAEHRAAQLRLLAEELCQAEQRERDRLAQVLHDHLQPLLVGARLRLETLEFPGPKARRPQAVSKMIELLVEAMDCARALSVELSPPVLKREGLGAALQWLRQWLDQKYSFTIDLALEPSAEPAEETTRLLAFQAVRELLLNVIKHAGVHRARVRMAATPEGLTEIVVRDEGRGFDVTSKSACRRSLKGFGLANVEQRLGMIGGSLQIESVPGQHTTAKILLRAQPLPAQSLAAAPVPVPAQRPPFTLASLAERPGGAARRRLSPSRKQRGAPAAAAPGQPRIRVLLADDHRMLREGLVSALRRHDDLEVVGEVEDGREAADLARKLRPDVVVMDVSMPGLNGIEATRQITRDLPTVRVIGLSMHEEPHIAETMRAAGAVAYLEKSGPSDRLVEAIRQCAARAVAPTRRAGSGTRTTSGRAGKAQV